VASRRVRGVVGFTTTCAISDYHHYTIKLQKIAFNTFNYIFAFFAINCSNL